MKSSKISELFLTFLFTSGIDKHESSYDLNFLLKNHPGSPTETSEITLWNCDSISDPLNTSCRVAMRDYMTDPAVSKKVLESLHTYGVAFIDGVQPTERNTEFVIRELFPVHKTLFGEMWTFSDAKDHSDTAYTNSKSLLIFYYSVLILFPFQFTSVHTMTILTSTMPLDFKFFTAFSILATAVKTFSSMDFKLLKGSRKMMRKFLNV